MPTKLTPLVISLALGSVSGTTQAAWTPTSDYTFAGDWWHQAIKVKPLYDQGFFGKSILVGVIDTGINTASSEFKDRIAGCFSVTGGTLGSACKDDNGHGSHVAGIIAAAADNKGSMGIAPQASLLVYKTLGSNGSGSLADTGLAIQLAAQQGARVINGSLGYSGSPWAGDRPYLQSAIQSGALLVFAAGNDGAANPDWPARYASQSWANGQIIAVGAVDKNNVIASFSNRAGDAKYFYLVAPGVNIASTYMDANYYYMSGTSMAAPMVSGAAALLMSYWPKLSSQQTANILLTTATDLGARGVDAIYGRGLLNVQAAMAPVGKLKTASSKSAKTVTVAPSVLPASVAPAIRRLAATGGLDTSALDSFDRNFLMETGALLVDASERPLNEQLVQLFVKPVTAGSGSTSLAFGPGADASVTGIASGAIPFLGFGSANTLFVGSPLNGNLKLGLFSSQLQIPHSTPDNAGTPYQSVPPASPRSGMSGLTLSHAAGNWTFNGGLVSETAQFLGAANNGLLQFSNGREVFASATRSLRLSPHWSASATGTFGLIAGDKGSGVLTSYSNIPVMGYSLDLDGHRVFARQDRLRFSMSQSLKAIGGKATLETATYDQDQNASYLTTRVELAEGKPEYVARLNYTLPTGKHAEAGLSLQYKANAGGTEGHHTKQIMLGWNAAF